MAEYVLPAIERWDDWARIYTDLDMWRPVVKRLWAVQPELHAATGIHSANRIESGFPGTCAVLIIDRAVVVKFYPPQVAQDFERERASYATIGERRVYQPALLAQGIFHDRIDWPYLVLAYIQGEAWRDVRPLIDRGQALAVMAELGRIARSFHTISLERAGAWPSAAAWETFVALRLARLATDLRGGTGIREEVIVEIERWLRSRHWFESPPCLLNADLTEDHLLLKNENGRWSIAGLIDWADAEVGDPLYDWVTVWFSVCRRDAGLFQAFLHGYGWQVNIERTLVDRLMAMTFLHRFCAGILTEVMTLEEQRAMNGLEALRQALFGKAMEPE